jgi:MFS family permease
LRRPVAIFVAIVAALAMSQFMRAAMSVVAPDIMAEAHLTPEAYGIMAGAFFLGVAAAQIPTGMLFDRFGPRVTITGTLVLAGLGTFAFAAAESFAALFASRFLVGVGFASALMGGLVVAARWFPPDRFSQMAGLFIAVSGAVGLMGAATPMAWLTAQIGWRAAFAAGGAVTLATAVGIWWCVRDAPPGHPWHDRRPESARESLAGYLTILRLPGIAWIMLMAAVGYATMITLIGVWIGPYLHDVHGLDGIARGNVMTAMVAGSVVGLLVYGPLDRWADTRKYVVITGVLASAVLLALFAALTRPPLLLVTALLALYGVIGSYYITNIALGRAHYPDHLVGRGVTTVNLCTFIGVVVVQFATARLMGAFGADAPGMPVPEMAYRILFGALAVYAAVVGLLYVRTRDVKPSAERARGKSAESPAN